MRLVDYLDKGASLGPGAPCLTIDGRTSTYGEVRRAQRAHRRGVGARAAFGRATRWRSSRPTTRSRSPACSGSAGPAPCGARSTRATRRPRTGSCSTCSTARALIFQASFAPLVERSATSCRACTRWYASTATSPGRWVGTSSWPWRRRGRSGRPGRRPRDDRRDRRDDGASQGRGPHRSQPRGDDRDHADELPVPGAAGLPGARAADPRRRGALLPGAVPRRRDRRDARSRRRGVPRPHRAARRHAHLPAADADLHGAGPPGARAARSLVAAVLLVRRGPDVDGPARGGAAADRAGHGAAVRADRGADDDLDDGAAGPLPGRRVGGDRAALVGRAAEPARDGGGDGSGRRADAAGRSGRDRRARVAGDGRLLPEPGGHRRGVGVRLAPHRRHRVPRRGRLPLHRRPRQGHGHHRRLQRLLDRGRAGTDGAPGGAGLRRRRSARTRTGASG